MNGPRFSYFSLGFTTIFLTAFAAAQAQETDTLEYPDLTGPVHVVKPPSMEAGRKYPAIFWFHGTGGKAGTALIESYTESIPCFVVGMSFRNSGLLLADEHSIKEEVQSFQLIRDDLLKKYPIAPEKVFVSGFSKGGWVSAFLIESERDIAGAAVLGAGALVGMPVLDANAARGKPVYIGIGIEEKNQINAARLRDRLKQLGAKPSLDQWDETGHTMPSGPEGATGLRQWLKMHLSPQDVSAEEAREWAGQRLKEIRQMEDDSKKYLALLRFKSMPMMDLLGQPGQAILDREISEVKKTERGNLEAQAWERFDQLIEQELRERSASHLRRYSEQHHEIAQRYAETVSSTYALNAAKRIDQVLGQ